MTPLRKSENPSRNGGPRAGEEAPASPEDREPALPRVRLRNATATSPGFRVPGGSTTLGPREAIELPKAYLETHERKALHQQGASVVEQVPAP